ncbi:MAG: 2-dehydropantoate 2-reductase N-terminal domain-containing protein [Oscillospiraceae bacterium]|nr:2-dehydropantoate 2-reductase N-terminal domain-containing protein [Oscillospiraceae bacterium]
MKVLVYGAGVIGSYLAHVLCAAGNDVTVLARGRRKRDLEEKGLVIRHYLQRTGTVDRPHITGALDAGVRYDAVFAVMQFQQMHAVLPELAAADTPLVCLVGNNIAAPEMERAILDGSAAPKTVLFGFQGTGGRREDGKAVCVRMGAGSLTCGTLRGEPDEAVKAVFQKLFAGQAYRVDYVPDMDAWYKCHLAFILPIAYLCYQTDCDLRRSTRRQRRQMMDAVAEGYRLLRSLGYPILPEGDDRYFEPGLRRAAMCVMLWFMAKTAVGRLAASDHCRHAVSELEALDRAFMALRERSPRLPMPNWDTLRAGMPAWETLHRTWDAETVL